MTPSLCTFLSGLIDYAGLFPPAQLPMDLAIHNFARYRKSSESWMLNRFICPASRLNELESFHTLFEHDPPYRFSILGRSVHDVSLFRTFLAEDYAALERFQHQYPETVVADSFEVRMPDEAYEHPEALLELIRHVGCLDGCLGSIYIESRLDTNWEEQVSSTVLALALYNKNRSGARPEAGFKLRCGGLTASSFPSLDQVAFVLASCRDAAVPFKATAGLHHPVRQYDASVRTHRHGFINIFCAGVMAHSLKLDTDEICEILAEVDTEAFSFTESGFSWKTRHVSLQQLAKARTTFAHSYGSCNFDDPRQDLKHAGLLLTFDAI